MNYRILLMVCGCCVCLSLESPASAQVRLSLKEAEDKMHSLVQMERASDIESYRPEFFYSSVRLT